jgi:pyruvate carboxylase subunit B
MLGTILKIKVSVGKSVKQGEVLAVLEAMKMENDIIAPCAGVVRSIEAKEGQSLDEGAPVMVIG